MTIGKLHFSAFLALLFFGLTGPVQAMPRLGLDRQGVIVSVDLPGKQMVLRTSECGELLRFTWNRRTVFIKYNAIVDASQIPIGEFVEVRFHRPLFGRPFVTRLRVQGGR